MFINTFGLSDSVIYQTKYTNTYQNKEDTFTLNIYRTLYTTDTSDTTFQTVIPVEMFASLKYKNAKDFLEPIRGASLDITINSSIENPYSEFLSFNEYDYAVEFIRNGDIIFEGYVNPEGITQSFSSPNWQAQLIAVDNLGTLKNIEFEPDKTLPSENQILLKILRKTKLWLPICYADDINVKVISRGANIINLFQEFWRDDERIINPNVFINNNNRGVDCLTVLKDILTKYNACITLQNMRLRDQNDNYVENRLCWVFFRPEFMYSNLKTYQQGYKVIDYSFTINTQNIYPFGSVEKYNAENEYYTRNNYKAIYSDVEVPYPRPSYFTQNIHVNSNQEIRARNTLQNFRFEQKWVDIKSLFNYNLNNLTIYPYNELGSAFKTEDDKIQLYSFEINPEDLDIRFSLEFNLPNDAKTFQVEGIGRTKNITDDTSQSNLNYPYRQYFMPVHIPRSGFRRFLIPVFKDNATDLYNPNSIEKYEWRLKEDLPTQTNASTTLDIVKSQFTYHFSYLFYTTGIINYGDEINNEFTVNIFPDVIKPGGEVRFYFKDFSAVYDIFSSTNQSSFNDFLFKLDDLKVKIESPSGLGKGEFHDAERKDKASTKLEDPVKIINADTDTDVFANGLQKRVEASGNTFEIDNYPFWTTRSRLAVQGDFESYASNLLEVMSIERLRLRNAPRLLFSGDVYGYISYTAIVNYIFFGAKRFAIISYNYDTVENVTSITAMEIESGASDANYNYENSIIFDEEKNKLINE